MDLLRYWKGSYRQVHYQWEHGTVLTKCQCRAGKILRIFPLKHSMCLKARKFAQSQHFHLHSHNTFWSRIVMASLQMVQNTTRAVCSCLDKTHVEKGATTCKPATLNNLLQHCIQQSQLNGSVKSRYSTRVSFK